jgi:2-isopropylmalate synthase
MLVSARARSAAARAVRRALPLRAFSSQAAKPATDKLWIFDTTLRDGEQSPGASRS